jgi:hypothetical protein
MARQNQMLRDDQAGITAHSGFTTRTWGTPEGYMTEVTVNSVLPAIAGGAALGVGKKAVSLPAGVRLVTDLSMSIAIHGGVNIVADTPEVGFGTTIASGANATLGAVAAGAENLITGVVATDCNGADATPTVGTQATDLLIAAADSHDIYLNVADTWAASGDAAAEISGTFTFRWR